ncbi:transposase DNA-binding-containing protein, partial [Aerosakkonema sp. BLCC-F183]|uniref:IS4/Tn5 family transposase DNA-binding protein n=1 Tax=Aerosakkonema sp. BLCC-F183 TaxID=3342834 RepID=UPI0035B796DC
MSWAAEELKAAELGDKRRNKRLIKIVEDLASSPEESIPQASRDAAAVQGAYDFFDNPRIKASDILAAHTKSTIERAKQNSLVLAIQDT